MDQEQKFEEQTSYLDYRAKPKKQAEKKYNSPERQVKIFLGEDSEPQKNATCPKYYSQEFSEPRFNLSIFDPKGMYFSVYCEVPVPNYNVLTGKDYVFYFQNTPIM